MSIQGLISGFCWARESRDSARERERERESLGSTKERGERRVFFIIE
jgi:hypothetical protein